MQGVEPQVRLELTMSTDTSSLSIDGSETAEVRIQRLIKENPVVIFSRPSCCMCHVMRNLLRTIGVHPTVIALDDCEISSVPCDVTPALFVGGAAIGGLETLVGLHVSGHLVAMLADAGALSQPKWLGKYPISGF